MEAEDQRDQRGRVWRALRQIAADLDRLGVPFAVAGALALQHHDLVGRSTNDVDLLLNSEADLRVVHDRLLGRGYSRKSPDSRHIREDATHVRIEFLIAGEYPGDGRPKPVAFPSPAAVSERDAAGLPFVDLRTLIELKLASAKSAAHRIKDRADVLDLIHAHRLPADFAGGLSPYVQTEFRELAALPPPEVAD